jgi:hypothetical protein
MTGVRGRRQIYGLGKEVVDLAFRGSVSRIGGMSLADLQREAEAFWVKARPLRPRRGAAQPPCRRRGCVLHCKHCWCTASDPALDVLSNGLGFF